VYIVDPHGARRFFPIQVKDIQLEAIRGQLIQLFAEARERFRADEQWWTDDETITAEANDVREQVREGDPWETIIRRFVADHHIDVALSDLFGSLCLNVPAERQTRAMQTRVGIILKTLGYTKKRRRAADNWKSLEYYYVRHENET
jgi:predicted P-loop ATPase